MWLNIIITKLLFNFSGGPTYFPVFLPKCWWSCWSLPCKCQLQAVSPSFTSVHSWPPLFACFAWFATLFIHFPWLLSDVCKIPSCSLGWHLPIYYEWYVLLTAAAWNCLELPGNNLVVSSSRALIESKFQLQTQQGRSKLSKVDADKRALM